MWFLGNEDVILISIIHKNTQLGVYLNLREGHAGARYQYTLYAGDVVIIGE